MLFSIHFALLTCKSALASRISFTVAYGYITRVSTTNVVREAVFYAPPGSHAHLWGGLVEIEKCTCPSWRVGGAPATLRESSVGHVRE